MAKNHAVTRFDVALKTPASRWVQEGPMIFTTARDNGSEGELSQDASGVQDHGTGTGNATSVAGLFHAVPDSRTFVGGGANTVAGRTIEIVAAVAFFGFANLNANQVIGIGLGKFEDDFAATAFDTNNGTARERIMLAVNSSGQLRVITCNGAAVTDTDTGLTISSGDEIRVHIKWTVGTNVVVTVNDNAPTTVTLTLPALIEGFILAKGTFSVGTSIQTFLGGYWRVTNS